MFVRYINILIITICIYETINGLRVKIPTIFGRRIQNNNSTLLSTLFNNGIVPDVIDSIPFHLVQIHYPSGVEVNLGNELTPKSVKDEPSVDWPVEEGAYYTLVMTDPDVPSRTEPSADSQVKHWLVVNIPENQVLKGESLAVYRGSGPPLGSGLHRYVFLVYKQLKPITHSETILPTPGREGRTGFKVRDFAKKYKLGEPIAANFFVAQYDDYVGLRNMRAQNRPKPQTTTTTEQTMIEIPITSQPIEQQVVEQQVIQQEEAQEVMTEPPIRNRVRSMSRMKARRAQLQDWAQKMPKTPKFPQMICMSYDRYMAAQEALSLIKNRYY